MFKYKCQECKTIYSTLGKAESCCKGNKNFPKASVIHTSNIFGDEDGNKSEHTR